MTKVSIADAEKDLSVLLDRARSEEVSIVNKDGGKFLLLSMGPKAREERLAAFQRMDDLAERASAELEKSLAADGITIEEFLKDALVDV